MLINFNDLFFTSNKVHGIIHISAHKLEENFKNKDQYNFINIDIQGYELEALKGMPKQLKIASYLYL